MTIPSYSVQKPGLFTAIAVMTLASGIVNLFWGFIASATALGTIIGVVCLPLTILPSLLGIFEIIYAAKLLSEPSQSIQPSQSIAAFEIMCFLIGNVFSMVVGILALVFYNDLSVRDYFARLNGTLRPAPATVSPIPPSLPEPESAMIEGEKSLEPALPQSEETPEKPKRIRKVAGK